MDQFNNEFVNLGDLIYNSSQLMLEQLQSYALENIKNKIQTSINNDTKVDETEEYQVYSSSEAKKIRLREVLSKQLDLLKCLSSVTRYSQLDVSI